MSGTFGDVELESEVILEDNMTLNRIMAEPQGTARHLVGGSEGGGYYRFARVALDKVTTPGPPLISQCASFDAEDDALGLMASFPHARAGAQQERDERHEQGLRHFQAEITKKWVPRRPHARRHTRELGDRPRSPPLVELGMPLQGYFSSRSVEVSRPRRPHTFPHTGRLAFLRAHALLHCLAP